MWELWLVAKDAISSGKADRAYILGGICNLTSPMYLGDIRCFWLRKTVIYLAAELVQCQVDIYEDASIKNVARRLALQILKDVDKYFEDQETMVLLQKLPNEL